MLEQQFKSVDSLADSLSEAAEKWLSSDEMKPLLEQLGQASGGSDLGLTITVELNAWDEERENSLKLLSTGVSSSSGNTPYVCHGDSSIHRYVCDGELCELPHDHCPHCWGEWDFKYKHRTCPSCSYELGKQVKILLDSDTCPFCEDGTVTFEEPCCTNCERDIDTSTVAWG